MCPSDTTPTFGLNQQAEELKHTDSNLQGPPPGSPGEPPVKGKPGRKPAVDLGRLYYLYLSRPTQDRLDELMKQCVKFLENRVLYWVSCRGFYPSWLHPSTF